jgi:hypothetical protein
MLFHVSDYDDEPPDGGELDAHAQDVQVLEQIVPGRRRNDTTTSHGDATPEGTVRAAQSD